MDKNDIIRLIENDEWMMDLLIKVRSLNLPDWWIGAGFVRSKVWDTLHEYKKRTIIPDIDVIYLDKIDSSEKTEKEFEKKLADLDSSINWSVKNQARMHLRHNHKPYKNSEEALSYWVETATCVGARIDNEDKITLTTPRGIDDLVSLVLRPTPDFQKDLKTFHDRYTQKEWLKKWPKLKVVI